MHILIVEDNTLVASGIQTGLELHGFTSDTAASVAQATAHMARRDFDACVLDLGLPDGDGIDLLRHWRAQGRDVPVLILTARGTIEDKMAGFQTGTDDYLTKPFAIQELEARLRALIRRERRQVGAEVLKVADLVLDPVSMRATRGGTELMLSPIGLRLLTILMRESPRVVTRQEIEREIWGNGLPDSDTLRSHLYNLRKVIDKPFDKPLLHTVQSAGYRIADIG